MLDFLGSAEISTLLIFQHLGGIHLKRPLTHPSTSKRSDDMACQMVASRKPAPVTA
jgi:hypothetical protein